MIMISLIVAGLIAILFGAPALVGPIRSAHTRRATARADQEAARTRREQQALAEQQRIDDLWRQHPALAGLGEWLRYEHHRQTPLVQEAQEAERILQQRDEQVRSYAAHSHGGDGHVAGGYRILVLAGLVLFLVTFTVGIILDYLIFRGLHPNGTRLIPFGLACLAVFGITIGSILFLGAGRHRLLPASATSYVRHVVMLGGAMLAAGVALYMTAIAPNRSLPAGQARIQAAQRALDRDRSAVPRVSSQVLTQDQHAVAQAQAALSRAQTVDRLSAGTLAVLEIPLAEAAVLGAELLMLDLARRRREQARKARQEAADELARANARFSAELVAILISKGHGEEVIHQIRQRLSNLAAAWRGQTLPPGGAPAAPGHGGPGGNNGGGTPAGEATPDTTAPRGLHPGGTTGNQGPPGAPPAGMPAASQGQPPITHVDPDGGPDITTPASPPHADGPGMAGVAQLPPDQLDETA